MSKSRYEIQATEKSFCPDCHQPVDMMADDSTSLSRSWFYICWACKKVFEIGVGPVERI